jgi:hypothetical protein
VEVRHVHHLIFQEPIILFADISAGKKLSLNVTMSKVAMEEWVESSDILAPCDNEGVFCERWYITVLSGGMTKRFWIWNVLDVVLHDRTAAQLPPWDETVMKMNPDTTRRNWLLPSKDRTPSSLAGWKKGETNLEPPTPHCWLGITCAYGNSDMCHSLAVPPA